MDGADAGIEDKLKKIDGFEDDPYGELEVFDVAGLFAENTVDTGKRGPCRQRSETHGLHDKKQAKDGVMDTKGGGQDTSEKTLKKDVSDEPASGIGTYTTDTPATIERMRRQMDDGSKAYFDKQIAAGGGIAGQRVHLRGAGYEYLMTSSTEQKASGNFLTEEDPGGDSG